MLLVLAAGAAGGVLLSDFAWAGALGWALLSEDPLPFVSEFLEAGLDEE